MDTRREPTSSTTGHATSTVDKWRAIEAFVTRTKAEQGLPPQMEDPVALAKVAALLREPLLEMRRQAAQKSGTQKTPA
jgi:hypothetical protein